MIQFVTSFFQILKYKTNRNKTGLKPQLKEQINVDDLIGNQFFYVKRSFKRLGKIETHTIKCKIRGLRSDAMKEQIARKEARRNESEDDGSIMIRITGCEYKVSAERLKSALSHWGEVVSEPKEEVFSDPLDLDGTNRTGIYLMRIKPTAEIPELIPLDGLRLKIIHHQVKKLCTRCFDAHLRKNVKWIRSPGSTTSTSS